MESPSEVYAQRAVGTHRLALLRDGEQTYAAMLDAIAKARSTICLSTYILRSDRTGERFAEALIERARDGVEVNLLYDAWGSSVSSDYLRRLREGGVRVVAFRPFRLKSRLASTVGGYLRRDHRKILVVDKEVGFTGGVNIADDYAPLKDGGGGWRDTHLRLEGPAAYELLAFFLYVWMREGGAHLDPTRYRHEGRRPDPKVKILGNGLRRELKLLRKAYLEAFKSAEDRIRITNAYFVPTPRILRALKNAARRGVRVDLIVAGTTDVPAIRFASQGFYGGLLRAGVRIYEWHGRVLHAKTAVIDGRWSTVGSMNLDTLSIRMNLEANAIVEDEAFACDLERMFAEDLESCGEVVLRDLRVRPLLNQIVSWIVWRLRRWL
ncbi:phospholipase D-like domain-containing protein [Vulgatibacter incomptus]|uniref:Cardiolipin synthetase n=1 Tax=Vulgatibacter incomptus TaxID=1391653 RepID=A0A0K1PBX4_9BACT|nr:phospholipase D-like domain-containing protein [Vulgatibacter incomptus]AKU91025.1 Cardiolipin synthetase [Vulgatibacter incomptus]